MASTYHCIRHNTSYIVSNTPSTTPSSNCKQKNNMQTQCGVTDSPSLTGAMAAVPRSRRDEINNYATVVLHLPSAMFHIESFLSWFWIGQMAMASRSCPQAATVTRLVENVKRFRSDSAGLSLLPFGRLVESLYESLVRPLLVNRSFTEPEPHSWTYQLVRTVTVRPKRWPTRGKAVSFAEARCLLRHQGFSRSALNNVKQYMQHIQATSRVKSRVAAQSFVLHEVATKVCLCVSLLGFELLIISTKTEKREAEAEVVCYNIDTSSSDAASEEDSSTDSDQ